MRRISIGLRLTLCYVGIFALAQLIFGLGMWFILRESLHEIVDTTLADQVEDVRRWPARGGY
jgi:hypothetical protein